MSSTRRVIPTSPVAYRVEFHVATLDGIGSTIVVGNFIQFGNLAFINPDSTWLPDAGKITSGAVVPINGIDIFVGFTVL
jgi:hypothetical protein